VFLVDLAPLVLCCFREHLRKVQIVAGGVVFFLLTTWTTRFLNSDLLNWALGLYLFFALVHAAFPIVLQRARPLAASYGWAHLFPLAALGLMVIPVLKLDAAMSWLLWPAMLLAGFLGIGLAVFLGSLLPILAVVLLTMLNVALWIGRLPADLTHLPEMLVVIGGFAVVFFAVGLWASRTLFHRLAADGKGDRVRDQGIQLGLGDSQAALEVQVPLFAALLPFFLLMLVVVRLPLANPSPVFGLALLLTVLLLGLARLYAVDALVSIAFGCVLALEFLWHQNHFSAENAGIPLLWYLGFYGIFTGYPFLFMERLRDRVIPWAVAALSGPAHFYLLHQLLTRAYVNPYPGLVPAVLAVPALAGLFWLLQRIPGDAAKRNTLLALFGGSALFFITLIFPIQFDRQWITIGWAMEGVALLWLFQRIPHEGLRLVGTALLGVAFIRLALNPAVLEYQARSGRLILNWFLYSYGLVALCQMAGARLLAPPRHMIRTVNVPPLFYGLGTVLLFLLLNIEIADAFSTGSFVTFHFSGNLKQDMTYSLGWAVFAFALFMVGIGRDLIAARYAGLGLLTVTLLKVFLHDLWRLGGLYRVGSLVGLAVVLILVSFIYQRFLARRPTPESPDSPAGPKEAQP
jgi:hypothetical protein